MTLEIEYVEAAQLKETRVREIARHSKVEKRLVECNRTEAENREQRTENRILFLGRTTLESRSAAAQHTARSSLVQCTVHSSGIRN
jgi:hypothetical protein